jgi:UDP-glucose 4-epimerase
MRVLITGGAGFIGSHLAEALLARGDRVTVLDNLSTGRIENLDALRAHPRLRVLQGDVRDPAGLSEGLSGVDAVFHLAAHVGVRRIMDRTVESLLNNVQGTMAVLERAAGARLRTVLFSSSEVYGKRNGEPLDEGDDLAIGAPSVSRWSYATGKAVDESLALAYHAERRLPVTVVRCFNTCGPRQTDRYGMVLPTFVRQALAGTPLTVHGDGRQSRCFSAVSDVVRGALLLFDCPAAAGEIFNVGSDREVTILDLARRVVELAHSGSPIVTVPYAQVFGEGFEDVRRRVPSLAKIRAFVGYEPRISLDELLRATIESFGPAEIRAAERTAPGPVRSPRR